MPLFAATIFLSAFLLFQVQPLLGKVLLPWFGGTPAVWTTCMCFFQVVLLGGYAYAHWIIEHLSARRQALVHVALLAGAVASVFPTILPDPALAPTAAEAPAVTILLVLARSVGLPYFALSATGSLLQAWFARRHPQRSPYALYALSNAGSLLGLVTFPFLVEPALGSAGQAAGWFWGFFAFAGLCSFVALAGRGPAAARAPERDPDPAPPSWSDRFSWVGLAACGSVMLLAITNQMALDVASVPFLWVLPLAVYLLSFVVAFGGERRYRRGLWYPLFVAATAGTIGLMYAGAGPPLWVQIGGYVGALFVFTMVAHGELYRLRPAPARLTSFYLSLALGGALGGVLVGLVAPVVFSQYFELHLCLLALPMLVLGAFRRRPELGVGRVAQRRILGLCAVVAIVAGVLVEWFDPIGLALVVPLVLAIAVGFAFAALFVRHDGEHGGLERRGLTIAWVLPKLAVVLLGVNLVNLARWHSGDALAVERGFFGMLRVVELPCETPPDRQRFLYHGSIKHGFQFQDPARRLWHTSYFGDGSGVGLALERHPARQAGLPLRIGVLGLGAGTLLTYGRRGDAIRIYEIDPEVERLSRAWFTYFDDTPATTEVIIGDGRLSLEREPDQAFDVLVLDAFSSDAIPLHLLTREAFAVFLRHVRPDGVLAVNVTNRHVDIRPVVAAHAEHFGLRALWVPDWTDDARGIYGSDWMLAAADGRLLVDPVLRAAAEPIPPSTDARPFTDDYTNLFSILVAPE